MKKVAKSISWLKNVIGLSDYTIQEYINDGYPVLYVYSVYSLENREHFIDVRRFSKVIPDNMLERFFNDEEIGGFLYGDVCEVILKKDLCKK